MHPLAPLPPRAADRRPRHEPPLRAELTRAPRHKAPSVTPTPPVTQRKAFVAFGAQGAGPLQTTHDRAATHVRAAEGITNQGKAPGPPIAATAEIEVRAALKE